jgi:hypothetical protein
MTSNLIHLCQPDDKKSCGACCGLYNYADSRKKSLMERLRRRTALFRESVKDPRGLDDFSRLVGETEDLSRLYEVIYCCEYLGFLDREEKKVGCLLHPFKNEGRDLRDRSFYGRELCDGHFCPSYHYISDEEKRALIEIIDDWFLYGLCVTDIDLVKEYFRLISEGVSEMPPWHRFAEDPLKTAALEFFRLKTDWPFRSKAGNRFGKYYFEGTQYMIHYIDYESIGCEKSRFDRILASLASEFSNAGELRAAEEIIQNRVAGFVRLYLQNF